MIGHVFLGYGTLWFVALFTAVSCDSDESKKSNNQTATLILGINAIPEPNSSTVVNFTALPTPPDVTTNVCFLCNDGDYECPKKSDQRSTSTRSSQEDVWWLCDRHQDCSDGTDEDYHFCFGYRESDHLFSCGIPKDSPHYPGTLYMSTDKKCDDVKNCLDGEDEKHCSKESKTWNVIQAFLITAAVLLALSLVVLCVVKRQRISNYARTARLGIRRVFPAL